MSSFTLQVRSFMESLSLDCIESIPSALTSCILSWCRQSDGPLENCSWVMVNEIEYLRFDYSCHSVIWCRSRIRLDGDSNALGEVFRTLPTIDEMRGLFQLWTWIRFHKDERSRKPKRWPMLLFRASTRIFRSVEVSDLYMIPHDVFHRCVVSTRRPILRHMCRFVW